MIIINSKFHCTC